MNVSPFRTTDNTGGSAGKPMRPARRVEKLLRCLTSNSKASGSRQRQAASASCRSAGRPPRDRTPCLPSRNSRRDGARPAERHGAVEARAPPGVAGARPGLLDLDPHGVLIAVDAHLDHALGVAGGLALAPQRARASGCSTRPRRSRSCARSASAFMCATISTSPEARIGRHAGDRARRRRISARARGLPRPPR